MLRLFYLGDVIMRNRSKIFIGLTMLSLLLSGCGSSSNDKLQVTVNVVINDDSLPIVITIQHQAEQ